MYPPFPDVVASRHCYQFLQWKKTLYATQVLRSSDFRLILFTVFIKDRVSCKKGDGCTPGNITKKNIETGRTTTYKLSLLQLVKTEEIFSKVIMREILMMIKYMPRVLAQK